MQYRINFFAVGIGGIRKVGSEKTFGRSAGNRPPYYTQPNACRLNTRKGMRKQHQTTIPKYLHESLGVQHRISCRSDLKGRSGNTGSKNLSRRYVVVQEPTQFTEKLSLPFRLLISCYYSYYTTTTTYLEWKGKEE